MKTCDEIIKLNCVVQEAFIRHPSNGRVIVLPDQYQTTINLDSLKMMMKLYAKEVAQDALNRAAENAKAKWPITFPDKFYESYKESINSTEIILR